MESVIERPPVSKSAASVEERLIELTGQTDLERLFVPQRPIESDIATMEPTLTKLPSFRMIAGWFLLIVALVLAFIFTHRP